MFEFSDSIEGGRPKAIAAAERLRLIFPDVNAEGIQMAIPMPGHAIPDGHEEKVAADVEKLHELIRSHDAGNFFIVYLFANIYSHSILKYILIQLIFCLFSFNSLIQF